jgi:hypothetical protein
MNYCLINILLRNCSVNAAENWMLKVEGDTQGDLVVMMASKAVCSIVLKMLMYKMFK